MPRNFLADARQRLSESYALLDARIDDLKQSGCGESLCDRLVVARECVRQAIESVEHAEQAVAGESVDGRAPSPQI